MTVPTNSKGRLMRSAVDAAATYGIDGATTKNIVRIAGCSEALIYKYFADKDELMNEVFLHIDSELSNIVLCNEAAFSDPNFSLKDVWHNVWVYLLNNPADTFFLRSYQYSHLYTESIRKQRMAYNGSFDALNTLLNEKYGQAAIGGRGFLLNYIFDITLSFVEQIITGKLENSEAVEAHAWAMISHNLTYSDCGLKS